MEQGTQMTKKQSNLPTSVERRASVTYLPRLDVYEGDEDYQVAFEMPGVDRESVDITLENDVLTVVGHVNVTPYEGYELQYREYQVGDYRRTLRLSESVDAERIEANMNHGILRITLPKSERSKARQITVKAA